MSRTAETLKRILAQQDQLELALLFGSQADGSARPDSDVDLAVRFARPLSAARKQALVEAVALELGCPVDLVDLYDYPEPVLGEALKGVRLVGDDAAFARLVTAHLVNVADFLPLRQRILDERRRAWIG